MYVRQMTVADVERVHEIARESLTETYLREVFYLFINGWPSGQLVAVNDAGNIIGFISGARLAPEKSSVQLFAVDPKYRTAGVGSKLLKDFRKQTSLDGRYYIQLEVRETDMRAISFYAKRGFAASELLGNFYYDGGSAVRMICGVRGNS